MTEYAGATTTEQRNAPTRAATGPGDVLPLSHATLPPGVHLASVGRRIGAFFLSILLSFVTLGIGYAIWGLIVWGRGTTPALQVLGMRCWKPETGRAATWGTMALREIIGRFVEGLLSGITLLISLILMLTNAERRCLHDMIAGTVVVYDPSKILPQ
ncbi:MAG TPA: RDD family protein [Candidatus Dormibacteraeota bacterium]|nr:RDD family protein [Candidatus Dormibacteraeota bacterium]